MSTAMTCDEFKAIRLKLDASQCALAEKLGVSRSEVQRYERGIYRIPSDIAATLGRLDKRNVQPRRWSTISERFFKDTLYDALVASQWNAATVAKEFGIAIGSMHRWLNKHFRAEWLAANRLNRAFKHKRLYDREKLIEAFTACSWNLAATGRLLNVHRISLRRIGYRVIPELMRKNVYRRTPSSGHVWISFKRADVARAQARRTP